MEVISEAAGTAKGGSKAGSLVRAGSPLCTYVWLAAWLTGSTGAPPAPPPPPLLPLLLLLDPPPLPPLPPPAPLSL